MYEDLKKLSPDSKVWIYQADRELSEEEIYQIKNKLKDFIQSWDSHGNQLKAAYSVIYNFFVVVAVDESYSPISGCAIDKSVHFFQALEKELNIKLLDRSGVAVSNENKISIVAVKDLKKLIQEESLHPETLIFNNTIGTLGELLISWQVQAQNSWMARYFAVK